LAAQPADRAPDGGGRQRAVPWLKVAPPMPVSVPRAPFILLLLFVVVGGVLGILLVNTKVNENAFQLKDLERQQAALDRQEQDLKKQIAEYEAPNNLAAQARRLGLVPADSPAFIRLPDGRVIGVPRPAGGQPSIASGADASAAGAGAERQPGR
jgi:cell division protein FtsB